MLAHGLIENRLRYQGSIRQRSIMHMANKYQVNLEQSERTAAFALNFFDQTLRNSPQLGDGKNASCCGRLRFCTTAVCTSVIRRTTSILTI